MGILLASANFDLFLDKVESGQRLVDAGDSANPLYRFVETDLTNSIFFLGVILYNAFVRVDKKKVIRGCCSYVSTIFVLIHFRPSFMDPDWFGYATSGALIVSWAGTSRRASPEPPTGFSGSALDTPFSREAPTRAR